MASYDYTLTVGADASAVFEEIAKQYANAQKKVSGDEIEISFSCDDSDIQKMISDIQRMNPEIGTSIKLNFDKSDIIKQMKSLTNYITSGMDSSGISRTLKDEIKKGLDINGLKDLNLKKTIGEALGDEYGPARVTANKTKKYIEDIYSSIPKIDFSSNNVSYGDIINAAGKLEELVVYANKAKELYADIKLPDFSGELTKLYADAGKYIDLNKESMKSSLTETYKNQLSEFKEVVKRLGIKSDMFPQVEVDIVPEIDPIEFTKTIQSKLKGHSVEVEVKPDESSLEEYLDKSKNKKNTGKNNDEKPNDSNNHNVQVEISPDFSPQEFVNEIQGKIKGLSVDIDVNPIVKDLIDNSGNNFSKVVEQWNEADKLMKAGKVDDVKDRLRERGAFLNSETGYISNSYVNDKLDEFSVKLRDRLYDTVDQEVDSLIHSHPQGNLAAFTPDDLESLQTWKKKTNGQITKSYIKAYSEVGMFDMSNVSDDIMTNVISQYKDAIAKIDSIGKKERMDLVPEAKDIFDATNKLYQNSLSEILKNNNINNAFSTLSVDDFVSQNRNLGAKKYEIPIELSVSNETEFKDKIRSIADNVDATVELNPKLADTDKNGNSYSENTNRININSSELTQDIEAAINNAVGTPDVKIDSDEITSKIESAINIASGTPDINKEDIIDSGDIKRESESLDVLGDKLIEITNKIDKKNEAFQIEEQLVSGIASSESTNLSAIDGWISILIRDINELSNAITTIPKIDIKTEGFDSNRIPIEFIAEVEQLKKIFTDFDLNNLQNVTDAINSLKVDNSAGENLQQFSNAFLTFKSNLNNFSNDSKEALSSINQLLSKTDELRDLATILSSTQKKIGEAKKAVDKSSEDAAKKNKKKKTKSSLIDENSFKNAETAYKTLYENADRYYSLLDKRQKGSNLRPKDQLLFETLDKQYKDAANGVGVYGEALDEATIKQKRLYESQIDFYKNIYKQNYIKNLNSKATLLLGDSEGKTEEYSRQVELLFGKIKELESILPIDELTTDETKGKVRALTEEIEKIGNELKTSSKYKLSLEPAKDRLDNKMVTWLNNNKVAAKKFGSEIESLRSELKELGTTDADLQRISSAFDKITIKSKELGLTGGIFADRVTNKFKELGAYLLSFASFYDLIDIGRRAIEVVTELDNALTEMRKVSDEPLSVLKQYQFDSFDIADEVGTTSEQLQQSTADWMRLGETLNQAKQSAKDSTILKNVSEFENIDAATESLVAMSQAYKDLDKMEIIDKLNNVGNNFSISTDNLATALQKSAAVLMTQGNDIDEAIALITAGNAIGQDSDSTAAGIRTISLRIAGTEEAKKQLSDLGEDVEDYVVQTSSKTDALIRKYTAVASNQGKGVSVLDNNGNLRDTYDILLDISKVYKEIQEEDKKAGTNRAQALVEALAGKNRSNIVASILQNGDLLESVYEASKNSEGSAQEELDKYLDSVTGKINQLKNQLQELAFITVDSESLKTILDILSEALSLVTSLVDNFGLLNVALGGIGGFFATSKGFGKQNRSLKCPFLQSYIIMPYNQRRECLIVYS